VLGARAFHDEGHGYDVFGLHPPTLDRAVTFGAPLYERYLRVDSTGIEHVPTEGPAILVANHGGVLPLDAAVLCLDVLRRTARIPRAVADHFVPRLPLVSTLFARLGVVSGTHANVRRLLERGELLAIWPEGVSGPAKPFARRYQLQSWRVGFAEYALRFGAPIIPVAIVGAEESWPLAGRLRGVRAFGSPYLPIDLNARRFHVGGVLDGARARDELGYAPRVRVAWPEPWWRTLYDRLAAS
jgi:1-acyl-sn-glycerol-3-phosphate acyltransferase